jgi:DeoR family transcriptional regulator of aga operon
MDKDVQAPGLPTAVRRAQVLETVRRRRFVSVTDLSAAFNVSEVTIRNDLDLLAEGGQLERVHGGAIHRATASLEATYEQARDSHVQEKQSIGAAAAALVESGQTVLLDTGATVSAVATALAARSGLHDVTVFTNGLQIALELERAIPQFTVMVTGGSLRRQQHALVNPFGTTILEQIHGHIAFLECEGIDAQAGVTNVNLAEAEIKRMLLNTARRRVVVADGSKVGEVSLVHLYGLDEIDMLITDSTADPTAVEALREHRVQISIVGSSATETHDELWVIPPSPSRRDLRLEPRPRAEDHGDLRD